MAKIHRPPEFIWRVTRVMNRRVRSLLRSGGGPAGVVLLTTTGRKSGLLRETPLQHEVVGGVIYVAAARGPEADWFQNLVADSHVTVQTKAGRFDALAEPIRDPARIADFLEVRLERHPRMIRAMLLLHGMPLRPRREHLEQLAGQLALVALHPDTQPPPHDA
jgi:deazaflavin-dependent oxidoreductase (nitroreductase family)